MRLHVRCETTDGNVRWRLFDERFATDHATLCRVFSLDPIRTTFDLPSTARDAANVAPGRIINGVVFFSTDKGPEPIGVLTYVRGGEVIPDIDPTNLRDFFNLNRKIR